jgi:gliding motility-associated lipoprotein GldH
VACDDTIVKSGYHTIIGGSWNRDSIVEFTFSGIDTLQKHDIFIDVRNDNDFQYNNLFLIAELDIPTGETLTDTLEYEMASPDGQWLGKGAGSIKENKLWYKENIVLPASGEYTIRLSHAMRKNGHVEGISNLVGITDVGYEIVKSNK